MLGRILNSNLKQVKTTGFNKSLITKISQNMKYKTHVPTLSKTSVLRTLLYDKVTHYGMEAHNGISARIAEEEKFEFIWGSGLCISAAQAVPDANQLSSSEVVNLTKYIAQASNIPVLLDMDTGYGNFNNAMCTVRDMEAAGIAGGCIEDKLFPKINSFIGDA
jgi:phosphoenolpyruvate phosphomutase